LDSFAGHLSSLREWGTNIYIWYILMIYSTLALVGSSIQGGSRLLRTLSSVPNGFEMTWRIVNMTYAEQLDNHLSSLLSFKYD
jgi:hypothetical protein